MSLIKNNALVGASGQGGYTIDRSLRLRSSASAYLSWTPASAGNRKTWTWSAWVKRGKLGAEQFVFGNYTAGLGGAAGIRFEADDTFTFYNFVGSYQVRRATSQVFRDPSAWYHIIAVLDTTQATADDRAKLYVNGVQITNFSATANPTQNYDGVINYNDQHELGAVVVGSAQSFFDGYLTEINFIDGQALDPTYFGETDATTGVWKPISYSGTYGTNGFYLNFSDNTSTTTLGYDYSGNSNNWTANNISVTSGATYDSMTDVPTLTSEDNANYATANPLMLRGVGIDVTQGNLYVNRNSAGWGSIAATIGVSSGKWYWEFLCDSASPYILGVSDKGDPANYVGYYATDYSYYYDGQKYNNASGTSYGNSYGNGDLISVALDMDNGKIWFAKNGVWQASGDPESGTNEAFSGITGTQFPEFGLNTSGCDGYINFGQRPFAYTPPTGFKSLNTYNLPDSTVEDGGEYFSAVLYTGNGSTRSIAGVGFQPDWVWIKERNAVDNHMIFDSVRGVSLRLQSNTTNSESTNVQTLTAFDADGFSLGTDTAVNANTNTYVAWNWKANGSGVSNTDGSITSTVSANTTAGFSIVTYTGTGANATVGHGLGVAPSMVITKNRDATTDWMVYHSANTASPETQRLVLNETYSTAPSSVSWNNTAPTASVFSVGSYVGTNGSSANMVAYCLADVEGYSKLGSYTGNGSADGPFVSTNFKPAFVIVKASSTAGYSWNIIDTAREAYNTQGLYLFANTSGAEGSGSYVDILSNGFKLRNAGAGTNGSGISYIYIALAENPFKNALAR